MTEVAAGRLWAATRFPYLAGALFASPVRAAPGSGTIAVDRGWTLRADPAVVAELDAERLGRLLVHLTAHLLRDHAGRAQRLGAAPARWNRCADAEVNDDLGGCVPDLAPDTPEDLGCAPGGFAEAYYADAADGPRRWDCGPGADGCAGDEGPIDARQGEWLRLATAAEIQRQAAREPGTVAGGWLRWAESVLPSKVDWRRVLAAEVRGAVASVAGSVDYTYRRPSRRAAVQGDLILPRLVRPVPEVAIVCDTSGSMHERLLARALAEVEGVLTRTGLRRVRVLAVDTAVHAARSVSRAAQVVLAGGGGTDMGEGIAAAAALKPRPSVVVVLTDGYTPWPEHPPHGVRVVIGLLRDGPAAPEWAPPGWARVVEIDDA